MALSKVSCAANLYEYHMRRPLFLHTKIGTESKPTCPLRPTLIFLHGSRPEYQSYGWTSVLPRLLRDFHTNDIKFCIRLKLKLSI